MRVRWIAAALTLALCFSLAACGHPPVSEEQEQELPILRIGSDDYEPYSYLDETGDFTGIDVDLAREACRRLGYRPEFHQVVWENKDQELAAGNIDCLWGSFTMTGREDEYSWAGPYMESHQVVAVLPESSIASLSDLEDKVIAVQSTTKPEDIIRSRNGRLPQLRKVLSVQKRELIFVLLSKGYVDALAAHDTTIEEFAAETGLEFRILQEPLETVGLGVAFDKADTRGLHTGLNETLAQMREDGTILETIGKFLPDAERFMGGSNEGE